MAEKMEDRMRRRAYSLNIALLLLVLAVVLFACGSADNVSGGPSTARSAATTTTPSSAISSSTTISVAPSTDTTLEHVLAYNADYGSETLRASSMVKSAEAIVMGEVIDGPDSRWNSKDGEQWTPKSPEEGPQFYTTWLIRVEESLKGPYEVGDTAAVHFYGGDVEFNGKFAHFTGDDYPEGLGTGDRVIAFGTSRTRVGGVVDPPGYWLFAGGYGVFRESSPGLFERMRPWVDEAGDRLVPEDVHYFLANPEAVEIPSAAATTTSRAAVALPEEMPADFAFIAAYGVDARNVFDSGAGKFTKDLGLQEGPVTTDLRLTKAELKTLYDGLVRMERAWHVFTTPFAPHPDASGTGTTSYVTPSSTYHLEWSAGDFHPPSITWQDSAMSLDEGAKALRGWFQQLRQMIEATPEWKAMPSMTGGYE